MRVDEVAVNPGRRAGIFVSNDRGDLCDRDSFGKGVVCERMSHLAITDTGPPQERRPSSRADDTAAYDRGVRVEEQQPGFVLVVPLRDSPERDRRPDVGSLGEYAENKRLDHVSKVASATAQRHDVGLIAPAGTRAVEKTTTNRPQKPFRAVSGSVVDAAGRTICDTSVGLSQGFRGHVCAAYAEHIAALLNAEKPPDIPDRDENPHFNY